MKKIVIHSDGACHGNPGPGGWAAVLQYGEHRREVSGGSPATTNNRMEIQAAIGALAALKESCEVEFHTDSVYLRNGITVWVHAWKRKGWISKKKPIKNRDLWETLDAEVSRHRVTWHWVKGHAGDVGNERCDLLATQEIEKIRKKYTPQQLKIELQSFKAREEITPEAEESLLF